MTARALGTKLLLVAAAVAISTPVSAACSMWKEKPVLALIAFGTPHRTAHLSCLGTATLVSVTPAMFMSEIRFGPEQESRGPLYRCVTQDGVQLSGVIKARFVRAPDHCDIRFLTDQTHFLAPEQSRKSVQSSADGGYLTPIVTGYNSVDGADYDIFWAVTLVGWREPAAQ